MSNDALALLGHLIGDGCTLPRHVQQYTTVDLGLAETVASLARRVFGGAVTPRINWERGWYQVYLSATGRLTHRVRNPIAKWLDGLGIFGLRSYQKFVPEAVFEIGLVAVDKGVLDEVLRKGVVSVTIIPSHPQQGRLILVRYLAEAQKYLIISGERRYHAARAAGLREVPCIEKDADDAETLEIALIENLQRKDLTPFEEADGLQALADRFALTHDEIGHKIGKARSSVTESLSLHAIPDAVKALAIEKGVVSKGELLQVARQPDEARMKSLVLRFAQGLVNRDQAREERQKKPRATIFTFVAPNENYKLTLKFRKNNVPREEIILALRSILESLEAGS